MLLDVVLYQLVMNIKNTRLIEGWILNVIKESRCCEIPA